MTARLDWHDLKLFVAVAEAGALTGAAREAGLSTATLGRRMLALEAATGLRLFARGKQGYALTTAGADLLAHARDVQAAMERLELWRVAIDPKPVVRISAGAWISSFLAMHIGRLAGPGDGWGIAFPCHQRQGRHSPPRGRYRHPQPKARRGMARRPPARQGALREL